MQPLAVYKKVVNGFFNLEFENWILLNDTVPSVRWKKY